jgi:hypothetical protein
MAHLSLSLGHSLLVGAAAAVMAAATPSLAQDGPAADGSWPACSRTVTDNCMQREGGEHHTVRATTHHKRAVRHKKAHHVAKPATATTPR